MKEEKMQNEKSATKNKNLNMAIILLILVIIASSVVGIFAWAKYQTAVNGNSSGQVAKWYFDLKNTDGTSLAETGTVDLASTKYNNVADKRIAPGTSGEFDLVIDTTGTETSLVYEVNINLTDCPRNMIFYRKVGTEKKVLSSGSDTLTRTLNIKQYVPVEEVNGTNTETIMWEWLYQTGTTDSEINQNNQKDTEDAGKTVTMNITATGTEVLEDTTVSKIYAKLYTDGTLMLSSTNYTDTSRTLEEGGDYGNIISNTDGFIGDSDADKVKKVVVKDKISPTNTNNWFENCSNLTEIEGISNFDMSNNTSMQYMFYGCESLTELDLSGWDTSSLMSEAYSIFYCSSLTELNLSGWTLNNPAAMFASDGPCPVVETVDLSNTKITGSCDTMFYDNRYLTTVNLTNSKGSNITSTKEMFDGCSSLTGEIDLSGWDTSSLTDASEMFCRCSSLTNVNLSGWTLNNPSAMFYMDGYSHLETVDLSNTKITGDCSEMFSECSVTTVNLTNSKGSNITSAERMFYRCSYLAGELDLSGWDTSSVTNVSGMFEDCSDLKTIYASDTFTVSNVTSSYGMFYDCDSLVGGAGTVYSSDHADKEYARIDGGTENPGYFTRKTN